MAKKLSQIIVLTGVPRSGTTLCCNLFNQLANTLALHEPIDPGLFSGVSDAEQGVALVQSFLKETRLQVLEEATFPTKHLSGEIPTNPVGSDASMDGLRREVVSLGTLSLSKPLTPDFLLVVKHNALFSAMLDQLSQAVECFAIIRNPLAVLASWQSVDLPVNRGHIPMAEQFDAALKQKLQSTADVLDRQLIILDWFFDCYLRKLHLANIVRYEDVVLGCGDLIERIAGTKFAEIPKLVDMNTTTSLTRDTLKRLHEKLSSTTGAMQQFYPQSALDELLERILAS